MEAFNRIFHEVPGKPPRTVLSLSEGCPTDPQAEVLVFDDIEREYIGVVVTQNKATETDLEAQFPDFEFLYHRALFLPRKDYEH